ncbi:unnamed protein product [Rotaria magnacalcarata]|uniref:O-acyltransferase n=3 Tax=Rotaria magnacalcarata TaxID=392030 RepID=A0A816QZS1_9BILA|nr:unnamed protein product [Rotaria magnacalcarata]CAF1670224.1 unnamed protein product [Rotaria magnacalcarata]CAF2065162.1 unnamed protein product [Rotaria magnacalcarata]CAF2117747.1 unnamed protein product [Rotaria magnacalcarata]CAF2143807.1 unnamed protein product [Rotaria magnacalcarata]
MISVSDTPLHRSSMPSPAMIERPSLLSASSGYENYRGFLNLLYVILGIGSSHLVIENILKYGLLVEFDWPLRFLKDPTNWPSVFLILLINLFILFQYWLEIQLMKVTSVKKLFIFFEIINVSLILIFPVIYIHHRQPNAVGAFVAVCLYSIVFLKLVSYTHINYRCRLVLLRKKHDETNSVVISNGPIVYPNNLTIKNLYYFLLAPTLCYELNFPRTQRIRKTFLCRRFGEILVISSLQYCLGQQWILPILRTLDRPLHHYSILENIERLLRLALPNHLIWLLLFYVYFHSTLNLLAELLCFGDRLFYRDWWNATDLYEFWNRWNTSVYDFCKRHVYHPLVDHYGFSRSLGTLIVFVISAFFHEYLISVPLRMIRPWSFLAMILQLPMGLAVRRVKNENKTYGNIAVWVSLILIQPIAILLYIQDLFYRDFVKH